jgi:exodeoxyribonuclease V alpha subunit
VSDQPNLFDRPTAGDGLVVLAGAVTRITFRNDESGYSVLRVSPEGEERTLAVVGVLPPVSVGERIRVQGRWVEHPRFGLQLEAVALERLLPKTKEAIRRYLGSGLVPGIGPRLAERLVAQFGDRTLEVIEQRPEELTQVSGISPAKARSLVEATRKNAHLRDLTLLLEQTGLGARYAARIFERYGDAALGVVREDPYRLARDIWGVGFVRADTVAKGLGIDDEDPRRVAAGVVHVLQRSADLGDVYLPVDELAGHAADLLGIDLAVAEQGVRDAVKAERLVAEEDRVYSAGLHLAETTAAVLLRSLLGAEDVGGTLPFDEAAIDALQASWDIELAEEQLAALRLAHRRSVLVITGGPGTGKTTLTRFLLDLLEGHRLRLSLGAPTGRAARRLTEAAGREAATIHRLLDFDPTTGIFGRDESHPLDADVVLIDEASMVDLRLFAALLRGVPRGARLVLVGDANQLPSVGPGEVLRDLIRSGVVPTAELARIFRQEERSGIVRNAHRILSGEMPELNRLGHGDFVFVERDNPADVALEVRRLVGEFLPGTQGVDPIRDVQVLVPMYRGDSGADALNAALQEDLNPRAPEVRSGERGFRQGDRVIQLRNDYRKNVFNGEVGFVESVDEAERSLAIRFDSLVELPASEWDQVALAYAITVHKSQGSEYDWVVFPLTTGHAILLDRPLFYTAVTRARRGVILVGSRRALALALRPGRSRSRRTTLAPRLREELPLH